MADQQTDQKPPEVPVENQIAEWKRKAEEARVEAEQAKREADMLRETQLRMMANTSINPAQPIQPVTAEPVESEEELNNLFTTSPTQAVHRIVDRRSKDIDKMIDQRARQIFLVEAKKVEAMTKYPELRNPNSDFFRKVAYYMDTHPQRYNDPEGILDACARVKVDMGTVPPSVETVAANESIRRSVTSASSQVSGEGTAPTTDNPELDAKGLELAAKLGIDPKVMAARLKAYNDQTGEYAPMPGKTGKAVLR